MAANSAEKKVIPVTFPPGRESVATRPSFTGSEAVKKMMGIVVVAALAASAAGVLIVAITATPRKISSANRPVVSVGCRTKFYGGVLASEIASFGKAAVKCG